MQDHIERFPTMDAHYVRKQSKRKYLGADLSIRKMYEAYKIKQLESARKVVSHSTYNNIFSNFYNLSFHRPKKDLCATCERYKNRLVNTKEEEDKQKVHIDKKDRAREEKENDKRKAKTDSASRSVTFDLQQVLHTPCHGVSTLFYTRKLCVYNFTIYEQDTGEGFCYIWDETNGKRGACEIGTCLYDYVTSLPQNIKHLTLFSDSCFGQNKNQYTITALQQALHHSHLDTIVQKYLTPGHTEMEVDSIHSAIEYVQKISKIHVPNDWYNVIRISRRSHPYRVIPLDFLDFINFKEVHSCLPNTKKNTNGHAVKWSQTAVVRFTKAEPEKIEVKYDYNADNFEDINLIKTCGTSTRTKRRDVPVDVTDLVRESSKKYTSRISVSASKKKDLLHLCKTGVIPSIYKPFYVSLPSDQSVIDRLPQPDVDEESEDTD